MFNVKLEYQIDEMTVNCKTDISVWRQTVEETTSS